MSGIHLVYIAIPFVSALIGWITNYIAVKMIFRPRQPLRLMGLTIQGLIPRRQQDLARSLGETIERELISHDDIQKVLSSAEIQGKIHGLIEQQVDDFMTDKLGKHPMIAMFLQGEMAKNVKTMLVDQLNAGTPQFIDACLTHLETELDFKAIVTAKVENFDYVKLEEIVFRIAAKELKTIEILGAVFGFIIGLAQVALLVLTSQ